MIPENGRWQMVVWTAALAVAGACVPNVGHPPDVRLVKPAPLPRGASADWWAEAGEGIRRAEYAVNAVSSPPPAARGALFQAPNREQGFRTYFEPAGVLLTPRTEASPTWTLGLSLVAYGTGRDRRPVAETGPRVVTNRVEYRHDGFTAWFVNTSEGLEQGFDLERPLSGTATGPGSTLVLALRVAGTLEPALMAKGEAVELADDKGVPILRYGDLLATDASGRSLPARLSLEKRDLVIAVDAAGAVFPVRVDPRITTLMMPTFPQAQLGRAVATAGDVNGDGFSDLAVGAPYFDRGWAGEGAVFVYHGSSEGLSAEPDWSATGGHPDAELGRAVATAGDVNCDGVTDLVVGAPGYRSRLVRFPGFEDRGWIPLGEAFGAALVYHGAAGRGLPAGGQASWRVHGEQGGLRVADPPDPPDPPRFGHSVATAGDVDGDGCSDLIVGAPDYNAVLLERPEVVERGEGERAELDQPVEWIPRHKQQAGAAYLFRGGPTLGAVGRRWTPVRPHWSVVGTQNGARLGASVATAGDVDGDGLADVVIGAPGHDDDRPPAALPQPPTRTTDSVGAAFVFHASGMTDGGQRPQSADFAVFGTETDSGFGHVVGTAGDANGDGYADVFVGAPHHDGPEGLIDQGRVTVYFGPLRAGDPLRPQRPRLLTWEAYGGQAEAGFGGAVASAGDWNGDGYADLVIGADGIEREDPPEALDGQGGAFVYLGALSVLPAGGGTQPPVTAKTADLAAYGSAADSRFGAAVATAGDVDGDGFADLVVGEPELTRGGRPFALAGAAHVYHGRPGQPGGPQVIEVPDPPSAEEPRISDTSIGPAGDVNGDGYADVIVGVFSCSLVTNEEGGGVCRDRDGAAFVYLGSARGLARQPGWCVEHLPHDVVPPGGGGIKFGRAVGTAGDVNGDGYDDVLVGAEGHYYTDDGVDVFDAGELHYYPGSVRGLPPPREGGNGCLRVSHSDGSHREVGGSLVAVGRAGDVNGDGFGDVIAGSYGYAGGKVFYGSAEGPVSGPRSGRYSVSAAGDVNRDGYSDVVSGEPEDGNNGAALVALGGPEGLAEELPLPAPFLADDNLGASVADLGDVNDDGYADIVVRDLYRAYVYYGSANGIDDPPAWRVDSRYPLPDYSGGRPVAAERPASVAGDVNGDGVADLIVAYRGAEDPATLLFLGSRSPQGLGVATDDDGSLLERPEGDPDNADWADGGSLTTPQVTAAGDVNGDGYADVLIRAARGRYHLHYGNGGHYGDGGSRVGPNPRQLRAEATTEDGERVPVARLGRSDHPHAFRLAALGRTPFGRGRVKLEWEVKPWNQRFDGQGTRTSAEWRDTGTAGVLLDELVGSLSAGAAEALSPDTAYHWRLRLRYHPATTPWQSYSRWITQPWAGWQEWQLRTGSP